MTFVRALALVARERTNSRSVPAPTSFLGDMTRPPSATSTARQTRPRPGFPTFFPVYFSDPLTNTNQRRWSYHSIDRLRLVKIGRWCRSRRTLGGGLASQFVFQTGPESAPPTSRTEAVPAPRSPARISFRGVQKCAPRSAAGPDLLSPELEHPEGVHELQI